MTLGFIFELDEVFVNVMSGFLNGDFAIDGIVKFFEIDTKEFLIVVFGVGGIERV